MRRYMTAAPTVEPLTLAEAKLWLRVDHAADDALITSLIKGARTRIEARTGRAIMTQYWRAVLDAWPRGGIVTLPVLPIMAVTQVRTYSATNVATVISSTLYALQLGAEPPCLVVNGAPGPGRSRNGIEIDMTCGYGATTALCPEPFRDAIRLLVAAAYEARGPERSGKLSPSVVEEVDRLIAPYRQIKFGGSVLEDAA